MNATGRGASACPPQIDPTLLPSGGSFPAITGQQRIRANKRKELLCIVYLGTDTLQRGVRDQLMRVGYFGGPS